MGSKYAERFLFGLILLMSSCGSKEPLVFSDPAPVSCDSPNDGDAVFYVSESGSDSSDGSKGSPWASIEFGITQIPDGSTLLVGPGKYFGRIRMDRQFLEGITVRAEPSYQARLRNDGVVITVYEGQGITISGFDIAHEGDGASALVVQIQDASEEGLVSRIVLRNNIIHDSYNNDILKINNGVKNVIVERNVFYNQSSSDEHIDINSVEDVVVQDNIFFNDFESSGRLNTGETSSYIVIKDSNENDDGIVGSQRVQIRRNVFLHWQGSRGTNFVLVGEDGKSYHEAKNLVIENNLFVGDGEDVMRAPFGIKGGSDIVFRHNTITGDLPSDAFAFRFNVEGENPANDNIYLYNNIWSDPKGSMGDFSDTPAGETNRFTLENNLYWNGDQAIPESSSDMINWNDDSSAIHADPLLSQNEVILPVWNKDTKRFSEGSGDICLAFETLVKRHGILAEGSPAKHSANSDQSPMLDILGNERKGSTSIGAFEPK